MFGDEMQNRIVKKSFSPVGTIDCGNSVEGISNVPTGLGRLR